MEFLLRRLPTMVVPQTPARRREVREPVRAREARAAARMEANASSPTPGAIASIAVSAGSEEFAQHRGVSLPSAADKTGARRLAKADPGTYGDVRSPELGPEPQVTQDNELWAS
jgi:hypothetical protein